MTLIQAQQRYIDRVLRAHPSHQRRVARAARAELAAWARAHGMDADVVCRDAKDMAALEMMADDDDLMAALGPCGK